MSSPPHGSHNLDAEHDEGNGVFDPRPVKTLAAEIDTLLQS